MTEPKPVEQYRTGEKYDFEAGPFTSLKTTVMLHIAPPQPTLEERVDALRALVLDLFRRVYELEAKAE